MKYSVKSNRIPVSNVNRELKLFAKSERTLFWLSAVRLSILRKRLVSSLIIRTSSDVVSLEGVAPTRKKVSYLSLHCPTSTAAG